MYTKVLEKETKYKTELLRRFPEIKSQFFGGIALE